MNVAIRELKVHLSRYIDSVCRGNELVITKHGKPVARLIREPVKKARLHDELALLAADGLITLPKAALKRRLSKPVEVKGRPVSELILEERR